MYKAVLFLLLMALSCYAGATYTLDLGREGDASITVSLIDEPETSVILPQDADGFRIAGGSYSIENGTALIKTGKTGIASFSFTSNALSWKSGASWLLSFNPPENSSVSVLMPPYSTISNITPPAIRIFSDDTRMQVDVGPADRVSIAYKLESLPQGATGGLKAEDIAVYTAIAIAVLSASWFVAKRKAPEKAREAKPTLEITEGKKQVMETFNENDAVIVDFLLRQKGKAKRSELERKSGISKSSLSAAINRLEKRKIIEVERSATTHFIRLSGYFLGL